MLGGAAGPWDGSQSAGIRWVAAGMLGQGLGDRDDTCRGDEETRLARGKLDKMSREGSIYSACTLAIYALRTVCAKSSKCVVNQG